MNESSKMPAHKLPGVSIAAASANFQRLSEVLREASDSLAKLTEEHREIVVSAVREGMSEAAVAREAGISRQTVRDWAGKPKRGDIVTAEPYGDTEPGEPFHTGPITGPYVPRTDHLGARPPADAAWVDDGDPQGPWMVKASTIKIVGR
ncbi:hypothetical protein [Amycolatopsis sp. NPDC004378]